MFIIFSGFAPSGCRMFSSTLDLMETSPLITAFVAGLLALLGGFAGAALTRRTEYEKWLRQERSKAFADFVRELHDTRLAAAEAMYDTAVPESQRSMHATELFAKLRKHEGIARLYMSCPARKILEEAVSEIWLASTGTGGPADHAIKIRDQMNAIQALLESELHQSASLIDNKLRV